VRKRTIRVTDDADFVGGRDGSFVVDGKKVFWASGDTIGVGHLRIRVLEVHGLISFRAYDGVYIPHPGTDKMPKDPNVHFVLCDDGYIRFNRKPKEGSLSANEIKGALLQELLQVARVSPERAKQIALDFASRNFPNWHQRNFSKPEFSAWWRIGDCVVVYDVCFYERPREGEIYRPQNIVQVTINPADGSVMYYSCDTTLDLGIREMPRISRDELVPIIDVMLH